MKMSSEKQSRLADVTRLLVNVAMGRKKADLVIKNATLVNVNTGELQEEVDVAAKGDRIALVGQADHCVGPSTIVIDAGGRYIAPGFIDAHVHPEASMLTLTQFARAILPHGTTSVFIDPHEFANVMGVKGVRMLMEESRRISLRTFVAMPSCVPASPGLETSAVSLGPQEIKHAMRWDQVAGLGEMMNYPGVIKGERKVHEEIAATLLAGKIVEGHCVDLTGKELSACVAAGITSCHESTTTMQAVEKLRLGMHTMLREGSAWLDVAETIKSVTERGLDSRHAVLVTDDRDSNSIVKQGHMDHVVRRAIEEGTDPVEAIQMATLNPAEHFEMARDIGSVSPARYADLLLLDGLRNVGIDLVIAGGRLVAKEGRMVVKPQSFRYARSALHSVHLKRPANHEDFKLSSAGSTAKVRVIEAIGGSAYTKYAEEGVEVSDGMISSDVSKDILKVAVFERHRGSGRKGLGFVKGFGLTSGAAASTVAHDSHNLIVLGAHDDDMALAANKLAEKGGGMCVVQHGKVIAMVRLPIAGLVSDRSAEEVSAQVDKLAQAWRTLGCDWPAPYMTLSLLTLSVIPELRITDKGLLDTVRFRFLDPVIT